MQNDPPGDRIAVLFDVDGTLVDSNYLHTVAWYRGFKQHGKRVEMYRIHRSIGMGSDTLLEHLIGDQDRTFSEAHSEQMKQFKGDQDAFDGAADLLREIHRRGVLVALCTSAKPDEIEHLQDVIGAREAVDHVTGSQDVESSKPAPDIFSATLERCGVRPERAIAVGDTKWDIESANRSGLKCVCVLTGGSSAQELEDAGAAAVYTDVAELLRKLDESPLGELIRSGEPGQQPAAH